MPPRGGRRLLFPRSKSSFEINQVGKTGYVMIVPQTVVCLKIFTWILIPFGTTEIFNVPLDYSLVDKSCQALFYTKMWIVVNMA
jgi:hypothetical protein